MPVVIKDFEVVGNGSSGQEPSQPQAAAQPAARPLSARQIAQMMKFVKERARRLHAD